MLELEEPLESVYFNWLSGKVMTIEVPTPSLTYWKLLRELHNTKFVWTLDAPMDENRAEDGKELRIEFLRATGLPIDTNWLNIECSILEMLIAFSRRASFATDIDAKHWFWEFLGNLGLSEYNDARFALFEVTDILYTFIWRTYNYNGQGGICPLKDPHHDQRKVEIWYQFCEYVADKGLI